MDELNREQERQREFDRIVHEYYRAMEQEESPHRGDFVAQYPSFRAELESFFSDVNHLAGPPPLVETSIGTTSEATDSRTGILNPDELPKATEFIRDYLLLKKLGEGGFGAVYLAVHTQLEKRVAIKVLKGDRGRDRRSVERFRREIKAVGRFEHDHIVRALDAGKIDGLYFLVMEYIDGYDLSQLLACCGPLSVADACELTRQAALGLTHAHQIGLIHRDVKPSNLMLTPAGQVKLLDLGLAQFTQRFHQTTTLTVDGQAMGTLKYMAPEQFQDCRTVSANCDIYSLGVSLYEFLGGRFPTSGPQARIDCSDLRSCRNDLSDKLLDLISAMTEAEPSQRIEGAGEVAERLSKWSSGHDLPALFLKVRDRKGVDANELPLSPDPRFARDQPRRNLGQRESQPKSWAAIASAVAAVLLLIFGSTWLLYSWRWGTTTPPPVVSSDAALMIELTGEADDDLRNSFKGMIFDEQSGQYHNLRLGVNRLPPSDYRLELLAGWESNVPETFTLAAMQDLTIDVTPPKESYGSDFHVLFPKIPSRPGAFAVYHASLGPKGTPDDQLQTYDITLRSLQKELQGETECQWLSVTIESKNGEHYRETAFVLIDSPLYERECKLRIVKGFVEAVLQDKLEVLSTQLETLTAEWSDGYDPLVELTDKLQIQLPEDRVSVLAAMCVLFNYTHPAVPKQFSSLRARLGLAKKERAESSYVSDDGRTIQNLLILGKTSESERESDLGYTIERALNSEEVPFSFLRVDIAGPVSVKFVRQSGGPAGVTLSANLPSLEQAVRRINEITSPPTDDFTRALLPEKEGEACRYSAELRYGSTTPFTVEANVRAGEATESNERRYRWIEVRLPSSEQGAMVLIDEDAYRNHGRFVVKEGWYQLNDEAFDFAKGDATVAEESLSWLEEPAVQNQFKVHEVLTLLFNADLPSTQEWVRNLRSEIPMRISRAKAKRRPKLCMIQAIGPAQQEFEGYELFLKSEDSDPFPFTIQFSHQIPFGFGLVELTLPDFEISTKLVESRSDSPPLLGGHEEMRKTAARTQSKLDDINVRAWSIDGKTMVRQYKRYLRGTVTLSSNPKSKDGGKEEKEEVLWDHLSPSARAWIFDTQGHDWQYLNQGEQNTRALIYDWHTSGSSIILFTEDGERWPVLIKSLSDPDRDYAKKERDRIRAN